MNSNLLISTKSSGICFNIMRLLILTAVAQITSRKLLFLTKEDHIPILQPFSKKTIFIPYIKDHTKIFNNFTRKKSIYSVYDLKYKKFIIENYLGKILDPAPTLKELDLVVGDMKDVLEYSTNAQYLLIDYNDGIYDHRNINRIKIPEIPVNKRDIIYDKSTITINIKINDPNNKRIYEFWDEIIPKIKEKSKGRDILLISGNNDIKKYLCAKHKCLFFRTKTETNYSNIRGNDIVRGKPAEIMKDVMLCATTDFIPFTTLKRDYPEIIEKYFDLNFTYEKEEKFDILVQYLSKNITIVES